MKIPGNRLLVPFALTLGLATGCGAPGTGIESGSENRPYPTVSDAEGYTEFGPDILPIELNRPELDQPPPEKVREHLGSVVRIVVKINHDDGKGTYQRDGAAFVHAPRDQVGDPNKESMYLTPANTIAKPDANLATYANGCGTISLASTVESGGTQVTKAQRFGFVIRPTSTAFFRAPKITQKPISIAGVYAPQPGDSVWLASHPTEGNAILPADQSVPLSVTSATYVGENHETVDNLARTHVGSDPNIGFFVLGRTVQGSATPRAIASEPGAPAFLATGDVSHAVVHVVEDMPVALVESIAGGRPITANGLRLRRGETLLVASGIFFQNDTPTAEEFELPADC